jgi:RNA polymerase sigma-70 factor, ECF subfamily
VTRGRPTGGDAARAEFDVFVDHSYALLVGVGRGLVGDRDVAQELAQEACVRAWDQVRRSQEIRSLEAWAVTVVVNLARSHLRRRRPTEVVDAELAHRARVAGPTPDHASQADDGIDVAAALRQLSHRQRQVTVLRFYLGMDVREIAQHLGMAEGTVKNALFRAREALRPLLTTDRVTEGVDDGR